MKSGKRLTLRREMLSDLDSDQLTAVGGGTLQTFTCQFTAGVSCGGVCSVNCGDTFTCPSNQLTEIATTFIQTIV